MLKRSHDSLLPCQIFLRWNSSTSNPVTHHLSVAFLPGPCRLFVQTEAFNKKHVCSACANKTVQKQVVFEKLKASHTHTHSCSVRWFWRVFWAFTAFGHLTRSQAVRLNPASGIGPRRSNFKKIQEGKTSENISKHVCFSRIVTAPLLQPWNININISIKIR